MKNIMKIILLFLFLVSISSNVNAWGDRYIWHPELKEISNPYKDEISIPLLKKMPPIMKKIESFTTPQLTLFTRRLEALLPKYTDSESVTSILQFLLHHTDTILSHKEAHKANGWKDLCVLDVCFDKEIPVIIQNENFVQKAYIWWGDFNSPIGSYRDEPESYSTYSKNWNYIKKQLGNGYVTEYIEIKTIDEYYVRYHSQNSCGGSSHKQNIFNTLWEPIEKNIGTYPNTVTIWNYTWKAHYNFKEQLFLWSRWVTVLDDRVYTSGEIQSTIESLIYNNDPQKRNLQKKYIFKTYSAYIMYEWNFEQPDKIVYLWKDQEWLSKNIKSNGDLYDVWVTNTVIWQYWENSMFGLVIWDSYERVHTSITASELPIFTVKKFDNKGYYLLSTTKDYKIQMFAELCKPAVYIYDIHERKNSLTLPIQQWDYFTKLIPEFSNKQTWNFQSTNHWSVKMNSQSYDYLYYALKTQDYKHNTHWWIVLWENIETFFDDKLNKINFNEKEKTDFIEYWIPKYEAGKYYFVSFKYKQDLDKIIPLNFSITPNSEFRVLLDSYELDDVSDFQKRFLYSTVWDKLDSKLIQSYKRNTQDLEVFEWGGVLQKWKEYIIY